ncbi:MAG: hypothetical protein Q8M93_14235, partial [Polaromonas sp.]|uniref:hypothetical protein n=1 Tax=Polaromonas sp. TaxID=1869339 RepID=UPI0027366298
FVIEAAGAVYNPESLPAIVGLLVQHFEGRLNNPCNPTGRRAPEFGPEGSGPQGRYADRVESDAQN